MDLVKLSAAGGMAAFAALALVSTARQTHAESSLFVLPAESPASGIQTRIDAAFRMRQPAASFSVSGPILPPDLSVVPHRRTAILPARFPLSVSTGSVWAPFIEEASQRFGIPAAWVQGVMQVESGGRTTLNGRPITSSAGAMGLMQVMPGTFADLTARYGLGSDPYEPRANILAGAAYLREMYDRYGPAHFLAAYNAGPGRVDAHLRTGRPLPYETQRYAATLIPRLILGALPPAPAASGQVQDQTSLEAIRALALPPSRPPAQRQTDPAHAPVFVAMNGALTAAARRADAQPNDSLFVTLTSADRRQDAPASGSRED